MKRVGFSVLVAILAVAQIGFAHDPRTVAKDLSHSLTIEGAGKLTISYKSLHFNEAGFTNRKQERAVTQFNRLWKSIGKFETDFEVVIAGVQVPKGSYAMGFGFDANDNYKLILSSGGKETTIPLKMALDGPLVNYFSIDVRPENATDTFTLEARYGPLRTWASAEVPYLKSHDHPTGHEQKKP
ncbi:MAG TPA: hypothetical protein VG778_07760 [Blastocatellia bacterium]|jgi:hypothetical protein|nr:hypothetical protein [Blastocatellia bacterium]